MSLLQYPYFLDLSHYRKTDKKGWGQPYLIFALDLLGFSNRILSDYKEMSFGSATFQILSHMQSMTSEYKKRNYTIKLFSDSIFFIFPLDYATNSLAQLDLLIYDISELITIAFSNNFLIRGGACIGECVVNRDMIWGPGIIKSHALEEKYAHDARIVIEERDHIQLKKYINYIATEKELEDRLSDDSVYMCKSYDNMYIFNYTKHYFERISADESLKEAAVNYKKWITDYIDITNDKYHDPIIRKKILEKLTTHIFSFNHEMAVLGRDDIFLNVLL